MRRFLGWYSLLLMVLVGSVYAQSDALLREARMLAIQGDWAGAVERLAAVPPEALTPQGAHLLGRGYQALLQHERAVAALQHADTTQPAVRADLAQSLERLGLPEEAEDQYRAALRADSTNRPVMASLARLLADRGAWGEVAALYRRLVEADSANAFVHAQLGTAYARLDATEDAIAHYERAHHLNPRSVRVVLALTKVYYDIGFYLSARRVVDRALEARPTSADLWRRRGEIALKEEDYLIADSAFTLAVAYGDSTALDLRNQGVSRYQLSRAEPAAAALYASFERDSTDALTAYYLGLAEQHLQHFDAALDYLHRAAELGGQALIANVHGSIAGTYDQMDRDGDAIRSYRLALTLAPQRTDILFHLAALYDAYYADKQMALDQYERFLATVEEGRLPQMERYAKQRVQEIREGQFFQQGHPPTAPMDSIVIQPADSAGKGGR